MDFKELQDDVNYASSLLKTLSNEKRLKVICSLAGGEKNVGELEAIVGISQSALSQHLARLRRDHIVDTRRDAQTIYYSLKCNDVMKLLNCLKGICSKTP